MRPAEPRIGIVVVAFNAAATLVTTLDRIPADIRRRLTEVIILDDGSRDDTFMLASAWARHQTDITSVVVRHVKNLGYGGNQKAAYSLASARGLDIVVLLHGDGQYAPEYLNALIQPLVDDECDAVFGSRMMRRGSARIGGMPLYKRLGNRVLTKLENLALGTRLSEFHSGYRAYSVKALDRLPLGHNSDGFDFDTQIIIQLIDRGMRIVETPIPTYYGDEICYVNGLGYARDVMRDVIEYRLGKLGFGTAPWVDTPEEYAFKEGDGSSHARILSMLAGRPPCRILDLGCSGGLLAERLRAHGHEVTGVDMVEVPGVRERTDKFVVSDLSAGIPSGLPGPFDVVIAADVLEHLPRPDAVLRQAADCLTEEGELLLSIPNFGHWYPRLRVAAGAFGYDRRGPLDNTHLRFYSRRTLRRLVRRSGFDILEELGTGLPLGVVAAEDGRATRLVRRWDSWLVKSRPQLFAYQFVMRLRPHAQGAELTVYQSPGSLTEMLERETRTEPLSA